MSITPQRRLIAEEAARIMDSDAIHDFALAKRKAIQRLGVETKDLPSNAEIQDALRAYQRVFNHHSDAYEQCLRAALDAMQFFQPYQPKLVGQLAEGIASSDLRVTLHVTAESIEDVIFYIADNKIPYREGEKRYRVGDSKRDYPCMRFVAEEVEMEIVILIEGERGAIRSVVDGAPISRLKIAAVQALLDDVVTEAALHSEEIT